MALFTPAEQRFATTLSALIFCNPFKPERIALERQLLGPAFTSTFWTYDSIHDIDGEHPHLVALDERVEQATTRARELLAQGAQASGIDILLYADLATYLLYRRYRSELIAGLTRGLDHPSQQLRVPYWKRFAADFQRYFAVPRLTLKPAQVTEQPAYLLACFFQVRRAFYHINQHIAGASRPAARLRATVWESIFTHDGGRYFRLDLFNRMGRFPTLITGPSGTGKELVARAIGLSRFIPFDSRRGEFVADFAGSFHALNISALAASLVESELFGHARGAFTDAKRERAGRLEECQELGTVFLDEIGELDPAIQVKLLRVLQDRKFSRLGETREREFFGKVIAATNRDLAAEMHAGRFREDFYYRLCADMISTPSLAEQLADRPEDLADLVRIIVARRVATDDVAELAGEVMDWIQHNPVLRAGYAWPGNFRELEQCVWNVLIRKEYHPARRINAAGPVQQLSQDVAPMALPGI